ncbi:MAG: alpha-2-macroglobulin, partial [Sphingopyxis sp.]|nr:alpha-2-macroglobulin [Sphingopyxis sp.]
MGKGWRALANRLAGKAKLALILPLGIAMAATATADTVPQVTLATPGSSGTGHGTITRFTLRFSEDMVPLGDPRARAPATNDCKQPSSGRWVDTRTWVLEFEKPLPGGLRCHVDLRDDLATARGVRVVGNDRFALDTGGPSARAVLAGGMDGDIEEDQVFLVATNVAADRASVGRFAYCAVDGIGEKIPVDVLPRDTAAQILTGLGDNDWNRQSFTQDAGLPLRLPAAGADRDA